MMTEAERARYLIEHCANGSATKFAKAIGIDKTRLSKIVHGQLRLNKLYDKILSVYPAVRSQWLHTGEGYPGDISVELVKARYEEMLKEKDALIKTLRKVIEERL